MWSKVWTVRLTEKNSESAEECPRAAVRRRALPDSFIYDVSIYLLREEYETSWCGGCDDGELIGGEISLRNHSGLSTSVSSEEHNRIMNKCQSPAQRLKAIADSICVYRKILYYQS